MPPATLEARWDATSSLTTFLRHLVPWPSVDVVVNVRVVTLSLFAKTFVL